MADETLAALKVARFWLGVLITHSEVDVAATTFEVRAVTATTSRDVGCLSLAAHLAQIDAALAGAGVEPLQLRLLMEAGAICQPG